MSRDPDLILISELCRELVKLGLNIGTPIWITVDHFEWNETHPVSDPPGAGALLAERLKARISRVVMRRDVF